jgi:hypothetical protein
VKLTLDQIDWKLYDNLDREGADGRFVLEYPHFVNAFIDHFYLDLLEKL